MQYAKSIGTALLLFAVLASTPGCADEFFSRPPEGQLTADNFFNTQEDLRLATAPLYNQTWFDYASGPPLLILGDAQAGNLHASENFAYFRVAANEPNLSASWNALYTTVGHANQVIINIQENASGDIPEEVKQQYIAEARFIRGAAYTYIADLWGPVPIVTSTRDLISQPNVRRNLLRDVYQFAINDFEYAAEHLLDEPTEVGRVSEWSAKGFLARTYFTLAALNGSNGSLSMEEMQQAQSYAEDVIMNSGLSLRADFGDLFLFSEEEQNNRQESLFALQWTFEGGWGTQNRIQAFYAASSEITGAGDGWGGGTGVQGWLVDLYQDGDERRKETFMMDGDYYPELVQAQGGYTYDGGGTSAYFGNATSVKKYVVGRAEDNDGKVASQRTGIDTYMMRLPEMYFIYARAALGNQSSTSEGQAVEYFNRVRERANLETVTSLDRDLIFNEWWREIALEGHCWYLLRRLQRYDSQAAVNYIEMQNRGYSVTYNAAGEIVTSQPDTWEPLDVTPEDFSLPYPETDLLQNVLLQEDPVPYDFSQQGGNGGGGEGEADGDD